MPFTLLEACQAELIIKKSRFIACVQPVADRPAALKTAQRVEIVQSVKLQLVAPYALEGTVRHCIHQFGATIAAIEHKAEVHIQLFVPEPTAAEFVQILNSACQGRLHWLQSANPDHEGPLQ